MLLALDLERKAPETYEVLLGKEEVMLDACRPLNTVATKRRDNKHADFADKKAIIGSLESCEQATADFDNSLQPVRSPAAVP